MASRDILLVGFGLLASGFVLIVCAVFARVPARTLRGRRAMVRDLSDPALWTTADAALSCLPTDEPTPAAAVLVGRDTVSVILLGNPPSAPARPWYARSGGWSALRDDVLDEASGDVCMAGASDTFVAIGRAGRCTVLLDLAQVPGTLAVGGEPHAATEFFEALLSQVESVGCHQLLVAAGAVQDTPEADVAELVRGLPSRLAAPAYSDGTHLTFLACATPTEDEATLLDRALIDRPWLRVLILGEYQGTHMPLVVDRKGTVDSPTLDLTVDGSVLPRIALQRPRVPEQPTPERAPMAHRPPDDLPLEPKPDPASDAAPKSAPEPCRAAPAPPAALAPLPSRDPALSTNPLARRPTPTGVIAGPQDVAREPEH
jgi:hypothetical protein